MAGPDPADPASQPDAGSSPAHLDGAMLTRLREALADQFAALYGARPLDPQIQVGGTVLTFSFQGGLSRADESLLAVGRETEMHDFRISFLEVAAAQLEEVIEAMAGVRVRRFFAAFDTPERRTECLFVLEEEDAGQSEQRRALRNWGEQVRRNARELRQHHAVSREVHVRQREEMERVRRDLHAD